MELTGRRGVLAVYYGKSRTKNTTRKTKTWMEV
jgi:hypothetical protein